MHLTNPLLLAKGMYSLEKTAMLISYLLPSTFGKAMAGGRDLMDSLLLVVTLSLYTALVDPFLHSATSTHYHSLFRSDILYSQIR